MTIRKTLNPDEPITQEELDMLKRAESMPITFDEDCPKLTDEQLAQFRSVPQRDSVTGHAIKSML